MITLHEDRIDVFPPQRTASQILLAGTYEGQDPAFLSRLLPIVDCIEITPDTIAVRNGDGVGIHPATLAELQSVGSDAKILVHGIGLSIGSHDGCSEHYLHLLDHLLGELSVSWHSEHLAYTTVDGQHMGTMLTLPRTASVVNLISDRVKDIQERYRLPFLLENVISLLPACEGEYSEAEFLNRIAARTGCGLLLDIYNLECDAFNHGFDIDQFLSELNLTHVRELHITGGVRYKGFQLDVHSRLIADSTVELAQRVIEMARGSIEVVTYELLREAVPVLGHDAIIWEIERLARMFKSPKSTNGLKDAAM